jgi:transposase
LRAGWRVLDLEQYLGSGFYRLTSRTYKVAGEEHMESNVTGTQAWIGIDVSKQTLDVCLLREAGKPLCKPFRNDAVGFAKLLRWVQSQVPEGTYHFCLEATGTYGHGVAFFLAEAEQRVSMINPFHSKHAALSRGARNTTDTYAAQILADYCRKENPPLWRVAAPEVRVLIALMRRLQNLKDQQRQEANRLGEPGLLKVVQRSLQKNLRFLDKEIAAIEKAIDTHIKAHAPLRTDRDLLCSIPGISKTTAHWILAELPDVEQFASAQSAAAYAGLSPQEYHSGTSVKKATRLCKQGNRHLRRALYMPALTAFRYNPLVKALFDRLVAKGKPRMVAVGAAIRKLLMLAYGVLKSGKEFEPEWHSIAKQSAPAPA